MKRNNLSIKQLPIQLQGSALKQTFHLTKDDKIAIEKKLDDSSPAYLFGPNERVVVKLTERGQKSYKTKLYSRPVKEPESSGDIYVFRCSLLQAYNFFPLSAKNQRVSNRKDFARDLLMAITTVLLNTGNNISGHILMHLLLQIMS